MGEKTLRNASPAEFPELFPTVTGRLPTLERKDGILHLNAKNRLLTGYAI